MSESSPQKRNWQSRRSEKVVPTVASPTASVRRDRDLHDQMIRDWSSRGLRRIEVLLASHAAFHDFLKRSGHGR